MTTVSYVTHNKISLLCEERKCGGSTISVSNLFKHPSGKSDRIGSVLFRLNPQSACGIPDVEAHAGSWPDVGVQQRRHLLLRLVACYQWRRGVCLVETVLNAAAHPVESILLVVTTTRYTAFIMISIFCTENVIIMFFTVLRKKTGS